MYGGNARISGYQHMAWKWMPVLVHPVPCDFSSESIVIQIKDLAETLPKKANCASMSY